MRIGLEWSSHIYQ